jgi:hypothetical protein
LDPLIKSQLLLSPKAAIRIFVVVVCDDRR